MEADHLDWIGPGLRDLPFGTWSFLSFRCKYPSEHLANTFASHTGANRIFSPAILQASSILCFPYHRKCPHQSWGPLFLLPLWYLTSKSLANRVQTCIIFHPEASLVKGCLDTSAHEPRLRMYISNSSQAMLVFWVQFLRCHTLVRPCTWYHQNGIWVNNFHWLVFFHLVIPSRGPVGCSCPTLLFEWVLFLTCYEVCHRGAQQVPASTG